MPALPTHIIYNVLFPEAFSIAVVADASEYFVELPPIMSCSFRWESISDFNPPREHRYKYIPPKERPHYDRAVAQRADNVLLALQAPKIKTSQLIKADAIDNHRLVFDITTIYFPVDVLNRHRSLASRTCRKKSAVTALEQLPRYILKTICAGLDSHVDIICLSLTSTSMLTAVGKFIYLSSEKLINRRFEVLTT